MMADHVFKPGLVVVGEVVTFDLRHCFLGIYGTKRDFLVSSKSGDFDLRMLRIDLRIFTECTVPQKEADGTNQRPPLF